MGQLAAAVVAEGLQLDGEGAFRLPDLAGGAGDLLVGVQPEGISTHHSGEHQGIELDVWWEVRHANAEAEGRLSKLSDR